MMNLMMLWSSSLIINMSSMKFKSIMSYNMLFLTSIIMLTKMNMNLSMYNNMYKYLGTDMISTLLIILTLWITALMMTSFKINKSSINPSMLILTLMLILILSFSTTNLFLFYLMFETSMIPTLMMIMYKGKNPERFTASMYMLLYMIISSLPLLVLIYLIKMKCHTLMLSMLIYMNLNMSFIMFMMIMMAFLIKTPLFGMHLWLLKAHVEAPVYGSMILAAILLKLGTYGIIRMIFIMPEMFKNFKTWIFSTSLMGSILISLICLSQIDLKMIVAYSSVVHMNMSLCALLTLSYSGLISSIMTMISHGLCSSGLFFMVNLMYENSNSRLIFMNKSMFKMTPMLSMMWFFMCMNNLGSPPSLNFMSELLTMLSIMMWNKMLFFLLALSCMISSIYSIYLFIMPHHSTSYLNKINTFPSFKLINLLNIILHLTPLNLMILNLNLFYL